MYDDCGNWATGGRRGKERGVRTPLSLLDSESSTRTTKLTLRTASRTGRVEHRELERRARITAPEWLSGRRRRGDKGQCPRRTTKEGGDLKRYPVALLVRALSRFAPTLASTVQNYPQRTVRPRVSLAVQG